MPGIGPTLRDARIRARIDIAEVEARTKIRAKYLRAIENEEWDLLPGPVYTRSFLRTYGDFLGLDSRMLVEEFKRRHEEPAEHGAHPIAPLRPEGGGERGPGRRLTVPPWLAVVGVLAAVVVVLFIVGKNSGKSHTNTQSTSARAGARHKHRHGSAKHTVPVAPPKPQKATLQLVPTAPVYVCVLNGAHKALIPGVTYDVGQIIPTKSAVVLYLTLGNANVQMKVNGKPVAVAPSTTPILYRISAAGASLAPAGSQPTCT